MTDVLIIGGGLAGLVCAHQLAKAGLEVILVEKKHYPFHKVCGEYVSNEVVPFLTREQLYPGHVQPATIKRLLVSAPSGRTLHATLPLGGFGISRFAFDDFLAKQAIGAGANLLLGQSVEETTFEPSTDAHLVRLSNGKTLQARIVISAYGKRSSLDRKLKRPFFTKRSPFLGVKYHIRTHYPVDQIGLYNFEGGYCGISKIEEDRYCLCYLSSRQNLRNAGSIAEMEKLILRKNPHLNSIFKQSDFLYPQPEVINEISFETKEPVFEHLFMCGDAAGMIAPLCGNGMAMAIHSAALLSGLVRQYFTENHNRSWLEEAYTRQWNKQFAKRLWAGRQVQRLFGKPLLTELAVASLKTSPALTRQIISLTHGKAF